MVIRMISWIPLLAKTGWRIRRRRARPRESTGRMAAHSDFCEPLSPSLHHLLATAFMIVPDLNSDAADR